MIAKSLQLLLLLLTSTTMSLAARSSPIKISNVPRFFAQDLPETDPATFDWISSNFGLLKIDGRPDGHPPRPGHPWRPDDHSRGPQWKEFQQAIEKLNRQAARNVEYKVLFLARHGQGYHNVAESYYGTELWNCYWSLLEGNATSNWADAELTDVGEEEARKANKAWKTQLAFGVPLPEKFYTSPLKRSANTLKITWDDITLQKKHPHQHHEAPIIKEKFRETLGLHTCDRRSTKSEIAQTFPGFRFEAGFAEEDPLYDPKLREPNDARDLRLREALEDIFQENRGKTYFTISAHSGAITSMLKAVGHRDFRLATGAMIPVVVKVEYGKEPAKLVPVEPSLPAPECTSNPTPTPSV